MSQFLIFCLHWKKSKLSVRTIGFYFERKMFAKTAFDRLAEENCANSIITLCKDLDETIDSGIPCGVITEIAGGPGCGKTQIWCVENSMQLAKHRILGYILIGMCCDPLIVCNCV